MTGKVDLIVQGVSGKGMPFCSFLVVVHNSCRQRVPGLFFVGS